MAKKILGMNRGTAIGVGIGGVTLTAYLIYRHQKTAAASAAAATQSAQAASAYGYGSAYAYGYGQPPGGYYGYGEPGGYYGYGASGSFAPTGYYGYGTPINNTPPSTPVTTNAQWAQAAINQLQGDGYDPMTVSQTLGAYELGQPVTAANEGIVQAAIGIEGYPPQPGSNGYPPAINVQGTPGGGGGGGQGGGGGGNVTVPSVTNSRAEVARAALRHAGLTYNISDNATGVVSRQSPAAGKSVAKGSKVTLTLKKG